METTSAATISIIPFSGMAIDFNIWRVHVMDKASMASIVEPNGLLHLVLPQAEFDVKYPLAAGTVALPNPGPPPVAAAAVPGAPPPPPVDDRQWKIDDREYRQQIKDVALFKNALTSALDPASANLIAHPTLGYTLMTLRDVMNHMKAIHGTLTVHDITACRSTLLTPYATTSDIKEHIAFHRRAHSTLTAAGHGLTEFEKVDFFTRSMRATPGEIFEDRINRYFEDHPDVATQCFLAARPTIAIPVPPPGLANTIQTYDRVRTRDATALGASHLLTGATYYSTAAAAVIATTKSPPAAYEKPPSAPRPTIRLCWTHGINTSHDSHACKNPADGHQSTATFASPQGARMEPWSQGPVAGRGAGGGRGRGGRAQGRGKV